MSEKLRIGYIPLVDATAILIAVDLGFAAAEGLSIELVREVSWSNVRDKLNIGLFDAAHLLSPVALPRVSAWATCGYRSLCPLISALMEMPLPYRRSCLLR
jgi:ABC-type nitrate/sulfonate/bicarbonate transport system substrate-binding protein